MAKNNNKLSNLIRCKYSIEVTYLNLKKNKNTKIRNECLKVMTIQHEYDDNCMPMILLDMALDKALVDDMIANVNNNLLMVALYRYNDKSKTKSKIECFRKKFTYFIQADMNKNDSIDYNKKNVKQTAGETYKSVSIGLLPVDFINLNNYSISINFKNINLKDLVLDIMSVFKPLIIGPLINNEKLKQFILPAQGSTNATLKALNNYRVFFKTPYRFYQDWNATYLIPSDGKSIKAPGETYSSIVIKVTDIIKDEEYYSGFNINRDTKSYEVPVDITEIDVIDNTLTNKQMNDIVSITSGGESKKSLKNKANYSKTKSKTTRINNDNKYMVDNLEAEVNNSNFFCYVVKDGLDTTMFTINKKITIKHHDKYKNKNGVYLLTKKTEIYSRIDDMFELSTGLNLKKIG